MPERKFKPGKALLATCLVVLLAVVTYELIKTNRTPQRPPIPNPNGYGDFVKAAYKRTGDPRNYGTMTLEQLRALVVTNTEALSLVRQGLARQSQVPITFSATNSDVHLVTVARFKDLAQLLIAEGRLAEQEHRTNDAAQIYLNEIRFAHECCRGGVMIDKFVGIACESIGTTALRELTASLDAKNSREAAKA